LLLSRTYLPQRRPNRILIDRNLLLGGTNPLFSRANRDIGRTDFILCRPNGEFGRLVWVRRGRGFTNPLFTRTNRDIGRAGWLWRGHRFALGGCSGWWIVWVLRPGRTNSAQDINSNDSHQDG